MDGPPGSGEAFRNWSARQAQQHQALLRQLRRGAAIGALAAVLVGPMVMLLVPRHAPASVGANHLVARPLHAWFAWSSPSADARRVADWVARSGDNGSTGFMLIDKRQARLFVFDAQARLRAATPVLLGSALGDDSVPGIGDRPVPDVNPWERTTPAGRFVARPGRNALGEDVVWVDYAAAVSMHRVRTTNASEHRLERLASSGIADKRISYGCINVPAAFFDASVRPLFGAGGGLVVYVLPDSKPLAQVFPGAAVTLL
jgi:hypothetical protein